MKRRIVAWLISIILVLGVYGSDRLSVDTRAAEVLIYDAANMQTFQQRTPENVASKYTMYCYSTNTYNNYDSSTWYEVPASVEYPYNAGVLTSDTHQAMTDMANFCRWLTGAKDFVAPSVHVQNLQAQAFDRNFEFAHDISNDSKPEDMSQELWDEGVECTHNILASASSPQNAIKQWLNEGYTLANEKWGSIGHRDTILSPEKAGINFSYSGRVALGGGGKEGTNTFNEVFTAFPAPGSMPSDFVVPSWAAWTVYHDINKVIIDKPSEVQVKVTNERTGESYICTKANNKLQMYMGELIFVQPSDYQSNGYVDSYDVEITGMKDVDTGLAAMIRYTVDFFNLDEYASSAVKSATGSKESFIINSSLLNTESLKEIASILPQEIVVKSELGQTVTIPANGPWKLDEENSCFVNSANPDDLPSNMFDKFQKLKEAKIHYAYLQRDHSVTLYIRPYVAKEGEKVTFQAYDGGTTSDVSEVYQLKSKEDGSTYGIKRFCSLTSPEFDNEKSTATSDYYTIESVTKEDAGTYFLICYNEKSSYKYAYVAGSFSWLTVEEKNDDNSSGGKDENSSDDNDNSEYENNNKKPDDDKAGNGDNQETEPGTNGNDSSDNENYTGQIYDIDVSYRTHVQSYGWETDDDNRNLWKKNGMVSGTTGQAKRLEAINIVVEPKNKNADVDLGIRYTTHCQSYGWMPWSSNGEMNGTEGEAKRLEAIKIQLTGADSGKYDIYYRVHAQSYGWLGWAKNGQPAGTAGFAKRLEGIQILVLKKGTKAPGESYGNVSQNDERAYVAKNGNTVTVEGEMTPNVLYRTHVQSYGWQGWKYNGQMSGTEGQSKRLEGIKIQLTNKDYSGGISYITHVQTYGWQGNINSTSGWKSNGQMSGTTGEAKRLEAICIRLTGEMEKHYDVYYRVHAQTYGWLAWTCNGKPAGTAGLAKRLEGIQIVLVPKGMQSPKATYAGIKSVNTKSYIQK